MKVFIGGHGHTCSVHRKQASKANQEEITDFVNVPVLILNKLLINRSTERKHYGYTVLMT